jgi:hypothetical protein
MGFLQRLIETYRRTRQHRANRKQFLESVTRAISDGKLTAEEIYCLEDERAMLGLEEEDIKQIRVQVYERAFAIAKADGMITDSEEAELGRIKQFLNISDSEVVHTEREFRRLRLIAEIQSGNLPMVQVRNVVLQKGETAHWTEPGEILEDRVVRRTYEGGSRGVSLRICKGVWYRVGGHRGELIAERAVVPVSKGDFIITNKRAIFCGNARSFNTRLDKILPVEFYRDGVQITDSTGKPKVVRFSRPGNIDIVGAILGQVINKVMA